jgi:hypothetical protein
MTLCSNSECLRYKECARANKDYFISMVRVSKQFELTIDKCFIKKRRNR